MQLMTSTIAERLFQADQHTIETGETPQEIAVKYFAPWGAATWHIVSGTPLNIDGEPCEPDDAKDWHLFGHCDLFGDPVMAELGYVMLSELQSVRGQFGLTIERDLSYTGTLKEVMQ